jgi:NAD(P)-dependent dehydrogenase (short-subunit alcohol dehydrogenase family)
MPGEAQTTPDVTCRRLSGDVCVVTDAGRGVGREIAARLAAEGARVALVGGDYASGTAAEERINDADVPGEAKFVRADVTDEAAVKGVLHAVADEWDGIDGLVTTADSGDLAAAGGDAIETDGNAIETDDGEDATETSESDPSIVSTTEAEWDRTLAASLKSTFFCAKHATPIMAAAGGGAIIAVVPDVPDGDVYGSVAGAATASGVTGLIRQLSAELASHDVRANVVRSAGNRPGDDTAGVAGGGRTAATAYLLSDDAAGVTGIELPVRRHAGTST